ncbi:MAG: hypothetical protein K2H93_02865 [Oscillospiraceae bacterium]|nr:hypothetical protein [Oscillospiraceae bacterium]
MEQELKFENPIETVLNGYYKNASVGVDSITCLLNSVQDENFRKELFQQLDYYEHQKHALTAQMASFYQLPKDSGKMAKFYTRMTIRMKKYKYHNHMSVHECAKLMAEGTNMGMIQLHQVINHNPEIPDTIRQQGKQILSHEREYLDRITPYL